MAIKKKRRGFVMTGGGAKGLYEAGVIHAFHLTGMEFDVITGSSIGAMNSVFYADYLLRKRQKFPNIAGKRLEAVEAMDPLVKSFHRAWLLMPEKRVIDDSEEGPIGQLKDDLLEFNLNLPQLVRLAWWNTDPQKGKIPEPGAWPALARLLSELVERLGGAGQLLRLLKDHRQDFTRQVLITYLRRFKLERSLVPPGDDQNLRMVFTEPVTPLRPEHLSQGIAKELDPPEMGNRLVFPERTMREYYELGIDVRLTRANYRTGRLEISMYLSNEDFIRYMENQAWRLEAGDPRFLPLGSFRMQIPGNPNAINGGLASGRFPGVFGPYPIDGIYPLEHPDNQALKHLLGRRFKDETAAKILEQAYLNVHGDSQKTRQSWAEKSTAWQKSKNLEEFFPRQSDAYVDGGAIDNTPSNSAVDSTREWLEREKQAKRDYELELFVIWLHPEPRLDPKELADPAIFEVVGRTLEIQGAAKLSSDSVVVGTINTFGQRGEYLGEAFQALLAGASQVLDDMEPAQKQAALEKIAAQAKQAGVYRLPSEPSDDLLDKMHRWSADRLDSLPLHVDMVRIFPESMPLSTLQFTERFGYRQENALQMLTMGCYNTLWALREHLEAQPPSDDQDQEALALAQKWMGFDEWPVRERAKEVDEDERLKEAYLQQMADLQASWRCTRTACVFHANVCPHGAKSA
ncbi:MAG TPA: patatin-like phospholipase family protein [Anaerolineales bacterium]|nr:patatin-like phospholipase family protein [Anaerolineales bacterium]